MDPNVVYGLLLGSIGAFFGVMIFGIRASAKRFDRQYGPKKSEPRTTPHHAH